MQMRKVVLSVWSRYRECTRHATLMDGWMAMDGWMDGVIGAVEQRQAASNKQHAVEQAGKLVSRYECHAARLDALHGAGNAGLWMQMV